MLKLKLKNEPKLFKLKCRAIFPDIILANTQEKTVTPTKQEQQVIPDKGYDGLSKVAVNPIPDEYIIPSGKIEITENGEYDIASKATAKVEIPEPKLGTKTITSNGVYKAIDDDLDGYSEVDVETSGVDINDYFNTTVNASNTNGFMSNNYVKKGPDVNLDISVTDLSYFATYWYVGSLPMMDTKNVAIFSNFITNSTIYEFPAYDTRNATSVFGMFGSSQLQKIPRLNFARVVSIGESYEGIFGYNSDMNNLTELGGFQDLGKAYDISAKANKSNYTLKISLATNLTHDSLMNVINDLYDIANKGVASQKLIIGATNLAKLTEDEIKVATDKGWTVS